MKNQLIILGLVSSVMVNPAFAEKKPKANSFGDKSFKYSSQYKKIKKDLNRDIAKAQSRRNSNLDSRNPNSSKKLSEDGPRLSH